VYMIQCWIVHGLLLHHRDKLNEDEHGHDLSIVCQAGLFCKRISNVAIETDEKMLFIT
jgi:hypothetical protein